MRAIGHPFAHAEISAAANTIPAIVEAQRLSSAGNWYQAAENYRIGAETEAPLLGPLEKARLLSRAALFFEIADLRAAAARAYMEAATILDSNNLDPKIAAELYILAAELNRQLRQWWAVGWNWRSAAAACTKLPDDVQTLANLCSAARNTLIGNCYANAGDAFTRCGDEALWSCGAYWESGRWHMRQGYGYIASVSYRKALTACARYYKTHDRDQLRKCLPLTETERAAKVDPIMVFKAAVVQGNRAHQQLNQSVMSPDWAAITSEQQIAAAFHEFQLAFEDIGNYREAGICRAAEKECLRKICLTERRWITAILYWLWNITSGYGEKWGRWMLACIVVLIGFAVIYGSFHLIGPTNNWFDYFYFSLTTFATSGYGDIYPLGWAGKIAACAEILAGISMFGILLTIIASRLRQA